MAVLKVLIADDQILLVSALRTIMELEEDIRVVATACDGQEAYEQTLRLNPDVVLMDIQMPVMNGIESLSRIKAARPQTIVLMLTTFDNDAFIVEAMVAGANGFLLKDVRPEQLIALVRHAVEGYVVLPGAVVMRIAASLSPLLAPGSAVQVAAARYPSAALSAREKEIALLMTRGLTNQEIAGQLHLTSGTVKNYVSVIYEKLGTNDRMRAIALLSQQQERTGAGS